MVSGKVPGWVDRRHVDCDVGRRRRRGETDRVGSQMTRTVVDWMHTYRVWPYLVTLLFLPLLLWPTSYWIEVRDIVVRSNSVGQPLSMVVDRTVNRPFLGIWQVTIRQWDGAGWLTWCNASGSSNYRPDARYPVNLSLQWWTDGQCHPIPQGRYKVTTAWRIEGAGILPNKVVTIDSNIFEVTP